jgi:hypothetical protein
MAKVAGIAQVFKMFGDGSVVLIAKVGAVTHCIAG